MDSSGVRVHASFGHRNCRRPLRRTSTPSAAKLAQGPGGGHPHCHFPTRHHQLVFRRTRAARAQTTPRSAQGCICFTCEVAGGCWGWLRLRHGKAVTLRWDKGYLLYRPDPRPAPAPYKKCRGACFRCRPLWVMRDPAARTTGNGAAQTAVRGSLRRAPRGLFLWPGG